MKKILLLGLLFAGMNCFAQGTTQKEYNYASKGYADDLAMGKDIIVGYEIKKVSKAVTQVNDKNIIINRITTVYKLIRTSNNSVAAIILSELREDTKNNVWSCIPNSTADLEVWQQAQDNYIQKTKTYKCDASGVEYAYTWNMLKILSNVLSF
jgi:hypothetical protein